MHQIILDSTIALLSILVGFCIGFIIYSREKKNYPQQYTFVSSESSSLRTLISMEVQSNLEELSIFYEKANTVSKNLTKQQQVRKKVAQLTVMPKPIWSYRLWDSYASKLLGAFTPEEITQINEIYISLARISEILKTLPSKTIEIGITKANNASSLSFEMLQDNYNNELSFWNEFETLVLSLLNQENPIQDEEQPRIWEATLEPEQTSIELTTK